MESIDSYFFTNCSSLSEIKLPLSLKSIKDRCFSNCISLTKVEISKNVTFIADKCFEKSSNLQELIIENDECQMMEKCFHGCRSLTKLKIPLKNGIYKHIVTTKSEREILDKLNIKYVYNNIEKIIHNYPNRINSIELMNYENFDCFGYCRNDCLLTSFYVPSTTTYISKDCEYYATSDRDIYISSNIKCSEIDLLTEIYRYGIIFENDQNKKDIVEKRSISKLHDEGPQTFFGIMYVPLFTSFIYKCDITKESSLQWLFIHKHQAINSPHIIDKANNLNKITTDQY